MPRTADAGPANTPENEDVAEDAFERDETGDDEDEEDDDDDDVDVTDEQESDERGASVAMTTTTTTTTESVEEVVRGKNQICALRLHIFYFGVVFFRIVYLYVVQEIPGFTFYIHYLVFYLPVCTCPSGVLGPRRVRPVSCHAGALVLQSREASLRSLLVWGMWREQE